MYLVKYIYIYTRRKCSLGMKSQVRFAKAEAHLSAILFAIWN